MNPIILLWAQSRSMSSGVERVMLERGDNKPLPHDDRQAALSWDKSTSPDDWCDVRGWHQSVTESSEIRRSLAAEEQSKTAALERLCQSVAHLKHYLEHHLPFYHKLRKHSLTSLAHGH